MMVDVLRRIEEGNQTDEPGVLSTGKAGGLLPVRDRLADADVRELVTRFRAGTAKHVLAKQYGFILSSVKRVLRQ